MARFLVDAQLTTAIARFLSSLGHDAKHVYDVGMTSSLDRDIWSFACDTGAALISKDEDFFRMAGEGGAAAFIWLKIGNCSRAEMVEAVRLELPRILASLDAGQKIIQVPE